jgi:hypothetical protein
METEKNKPTEEAKPITNNQSDDFKELIELELPCGFKLRMGSMIYSLDKLCDLSVKMYNHFINQKHPSKTNGFYD